MKKVLYIALLIAGAQSLKAQEVGNTNTLVDPLPTQYFQNQYLANPAMAGIDTGLHLNAAYRRQWKNQPGVPETISFTADYAAGKRVGAGLMVFNDKAGLMTSTRVALTYAYHLPLSLERNQFLHFGLSLGIRTERINLKGINGEVMDPSIGRFNRRDNYFDGDFGVAYTSNGLSLQAALPNVVGYFKSDKNLVNGSTFFTAASYRIALGGQFTSLEPKVCFRGVRGFDNIVDVGANLVLLNDVANVYGLYHSSKTFTVGAGFNIHHTVGLQLSYSSQTAGLSNYLSGNFTVGLTVNLFNKR
ncbi:PorP/SprF family type IX secretion system membrane protein [Chitinophaga pendula]|uniref:PorP/SprF family type IX secretion system membrane protein n=1 Tax=Chitinophaga TaxID=79328 RepID=UPI000BAFA303|nr:MULTISPECIES: PorP/SprF family type IX secretion system membrane protein [Chitinophaga]ASZ10374.1 hypothetical protein CK934_04950 [Chitinophaga sp. MD30]UCJ06661.1 PorP/SprF family type IX secretion system membrane protein [Chitinophaga pendula]